MIRFACPSCRQILEHSTVGAKLDCPNCKQRLEVPEIPESGKTVLATPVLQDTSPKQRIAKGEKEKFCHECGEVIRGKAEICPYCGVRQPRSSRSESNIPVEEDPEVRREASNKLAAGLCGILLGWLGIHKFILGMQKPALIMLLVSVLTCGAGTIPMGIIGLIEGIIYLTKSDEDFYQTYIVGKKEWF